MEAHEDTERDAVVDRITYHYVRAAELINELGHVDGLPDDLTERALPWLERAAARANQAEIPVVAERLYSEGLRLLAGAHGPRHRAFLTGRARALAGLREIAPARADAAAAVEESRQAGAEGRADLGRALLVLADVEQKESRLGRVGGRARRGRGRVRRAGRRVGRGRGAAPARASRRSSATSTPRPPCCSSRRSPASRRSTTVAAWPGPARTWPGAPSTPAGPRRPRSLLRKAAATFEEIGDQGGLRWARGLLAWTRFQQGHTAEAGEMAEADPRRRPARRRSLGPRA